MLLFLVRHGMTPVTGVRLAGWRPGIHLSDTGRAQADGLPARFEGVPLDAIYSSPIDRCVETAKPLAAARKLRLRTRETIGEVRYGEWEYKPLKTISKTKLWGEIMAHPSEGRFPGGEAIRETQARAVAAVATIAEQHSRETVAVFTHADIVKMVLAHYTGLHLDLYARLAVAPASVSALWIGAGGPRTLTVNDTGSLGSLAPRPTHGRSA